jgi:hypothetical protein
VVWFGTVLYDDGDAYICIALLSKGVKYKVSYLDGLSMLLL